ncbi:MAG: hypothetical protein AAF430_17125 [Myxococcota bacterium]
MRDFANPRPGSTNCRECGAALRWSKESLAPHAKYEWAAVGCFILAVCSMGYYGLSFVPPGIILFGLAILYAGKDMPQLEAFAPSDATESTPRFDHVRAWGGAWVALNLYLMLGALAYGVWKAS